MRQGFEQLAAAWRQLVALAFAAALIATPLLAWAQGQTGGGGTSGSGTGGPPPGGTGAGGPTGAPGGAPAGDAGGGGTALAWIIVILAVAVVIWMFSRRRRGTVTR